MERHDNSCNGMIMMVMVDEGKKEIINYKQERHRRRR
jgi:hypothetical protein